MFCVVDDITLGMIRVVDTCIRGVIYLTMWLLVAWDLTCGLVVVAVGFVLLFGYMLDGLVICLSLGCCRWLGVCGLCGCGDFLWGCLLGLGDLYTVCYFVCC